MKIKELLTDESKWTTGEEARTSEGDKCDPCGTLAVCWCLEGAVRYCYSWGGVPHIFIKIRERLNQNVIHKWQDKATFEEVKTLVEELDI